MTGATLKIAQVGPLWESIPPTSYGGTERVVSFLTERLVAQGNTVTLFASGTAKTAAKLVAVYPRPLVQDAIPWTNLMYPILHLTAAFDRQNEFDVIHVHLNKGSDYLALPLAQPFKPKVVFTLHFPYPTSQRRHDRHLVLQKYRDLNFISISNAQRQGGENLNWLGTVYNGIDISLYDFSPKPKDYFFWLGKFNPDKGVYEAIMAAKKAGVKLILGGKVDRLEAEDLAYYQTHVKPYIDGQQIIYVGELTDTQKNDYFGGAIAFLNPLRWNEPFGLTMVEAMACGTPVIAFRAGSAPELVAEGKTGFLVNTVEEMAERMQKVSTLARQACRQRAEAHFTADIMANNYAALYQKLL